MFLYTRVYNEAMTETQTPRRTVTVSVTVEYDPTALNRSDVLRAIENRVDNGTFVGSYSSLTVKEVELS